VFVAAEALEFSGLLRHAERVVKLNWPLDFARKIWLSGHAVILVANGPGPKLAAEAVEIAKGRERLTGIVSTGFCGALDPALNLSDIFIPTELLDFVVQVKVGQALPPANSSFPVSQLAPRPVSTRGIVRRIIFQSSANDQVSMYCMSIFIQVSKSTASRPATAHKHVSPGRMRSRRRCHL
jgi:hypothetical protein